MKRKVKKYAGGNLVDSSGNPVRSGSGEPVRTRSDDEIAEDSKFGGYGRYMPKSGNLTRGIKSTASEDRPTSSGVDDYETMGKRAGATSPFSGPKEYISESVKEESIKEPEMDTEEPRRKISDYISSSEDKPAVNKQKVAKKKKYEDTGAKIGSQSFAMRGEDKKVPPLRKIGEAIMGTVANASKPYSSSMYDKMKGRKAGGSIKMASGGKVSSASSRADGIAQRGKTKGRIC
jgi:hypothetical protein